MPNPGWRHSSQWPAVGTPTAAGLGAENWGEPVGGDRREGRRVGHPDLVSGGCCPVEALDTQGPLPQTCWESGHLSSPRGRDGRGRNPGSKEGRSGLGNSGTQTLWPALPSSQPPPSLGQSRGRHWDLPERGHLSPPPREGPAPPSPGTGYGVRGGARLGVDVPPGSCPGTDGQPRAGT